MVLSLALTAPLQSNAAGQRARQCLQATLAGDVNAGQEWKAAFGEGWVFRVLPIHSENAAHNGWDLVVDREDPAGYPDALLVATPPYNSINQREVGTTYGLRTQDAIGWNPRSFRFLTSPALFAEAQRTFRSVNGSGLAAIGAAPGSDNSPAARQGRRFIEITQRAAAGEFKIIDARLAPGTADAASYAENWALALPKTQHTFEPALNGESTPLGELHWIRFEIRLWLPAGWKIPKDLQAAPAPCQD
jgi:hypothetical protein